MKNRTVFWKRRATKIWSHALELDNHIIGLLICGFAIFDWITLYDGMENAKLYFSQDIYTLPSMSVLNSFFSALYLTLAAVILLSLKEPLLRCRTVLPNLVAVLAAFGVYLFVLLPSGEFLQISVYVALFLIILGSLLVLTALVYLRQAFSVTPQARFLVSSGPYSIVRHPMYIGNILTFLGLALVIDSPEALLLFIVCAGLQIGRALYEEKLLEAAFPEYRGYMQRVGRFVPRFHPWNRRVTAAAILSLLFAYDYCEAQPASLAPPRSAPAEAALVARIASNPAAWGAKCEAWYRKATGGVWFTQADRREFERFQAEDSSSIESCSLFSTLQSKCEGIAYSWLGQEIGDEAFLDQVEATIGCRSVVGFREYCDAMKKIARRGTPLSEDRRSLMVECLVADLRNRRFDMLRPGM